MGNPKQNVFLHLTFTMNQYIDEPRYSCDEGRSKISLIASIGMDGTSVGNAPESITTDAVASETTTVDASKAEKGLEVAMANGVNDAYYNAEGEKTDASLQSEENNAGTMAAEETSSIDDDATTIPTENEVEEENLEIEIGVAFEFPVWLIVFLSVIIPVSCALLVDHN